MDHNEALKAYESDPCKDTAVKFLSLCLRSTDDPFIGITLYPKDYKYWEKVYKYFLDVESVYSEVPGVRVIEQRFVPLSHSPLMDHVWDKFKNSEFKIEGVEFDSITQAIPSFDTYYGMKAVFCRPEGKLHVPLWVDF